MNARSAFKLRAALAEMSERRDARWPPARQVKWIESTFAPIESAIESEMKKKFHTSLVANLPFATPATLNF